MATDDDSPDLRRALATRIAELGMTQTAAAEAIGVSQGRISRWLHGQPPSLERVPALARFLGCSEEDTLRLIYGATQRPANRRSASDRIDRVEEQLANMTSRLDQVLAALAEQGVIPGAEEPPGPAQRRKPRRRSG